MKILEHQEEDFGEITTATDLFLTFLRGSLTFHNQKDDTSFSKMLKGEDQDYLMKTFKLCKGNAKYKCISPHLDAFNSRQYE